MARDRVEHLRELLLLQLTCLLTKREDSPQECSFIIRFLGVRLAYSELDNGLILLLDTSKNEC